MFQDHGVNTAVYCHINIALHGADESNRLRLDFTLYNLSHTLCNNRRCRRHPDFDPGEAAFYYVRVIEIPTPRWTAYDRKFFKIEDRLSDDVPLTTQERAYTSPIWYTPSG